MKKTNYPLTAIKIFMKNRIQNRTYLFYDIFGMVSRCLIVFLLYGYVFRVNNGSINGVDYKTTLWSMFIYFAIMILNLRKLDSTIMNDVRSGNVEMFLNKPVDYVVYSFYRTIGEGIYSFCIIGMIGIIGMILFCGIPEVNLLIFIPTFIITFILGAILALLVYSVIGLLSFFMQDIRPVHWIVDKTVMVLGGSYLPVALFPPVLKVLAYISPFGAINFATSTVYSSWNNDFYIRILTQVIWIIAFTFILKFVYSKAKQKAMVNGG